MEESFVCELDLEGIVAKDNDSPCLSENTISTWYKIPQSALFADDRKA